MTIRTLGVLAIAVALLAGEARAQSARWAGCQAGAPTPSWATRDGQGCLRVEAGGTWGAITFRDHTYNWASGIAQEQPGWKDNGASSNPACTGSNSCNSVMFDSMLDNYSTPSGSGWRNQQVMQWNAATRSRHLFWKNTTIQNAWRCGDSDSGTPGGAWSGPNGNSCPAGQLDGNHIDLQMMWQGGPGGGGWWVMQDAVFRNSDDVLLHTSQPQNHPRGLPHPQDAGQPERRLGV